MTTTTSAGFEPADNWAPDRLLTPQQVADYLSLSPASLANERSAGTSRLPYIKLGSRVRYRAADVLAYVDESRVQA